ncbi:hypothetical protein [Streptomyces sp. IBSBF 3136]|uniref:hypothetical protein n=1 Tax=Streptomyces sp. IBSBF 3136 TaxID=2903524 RepID=UPI003FA7A31E
MTAQTLDVNTVTGLVADAAAAPSLHNAQPWAFRYLPDVGVLRLYADLERALPRTDPDNRGLHVGCGAALFNLNSSADRSSAGTMAPSLAVGPTTVKPRRISTSTRARPCRPCL